ncbi:hypothetical protein FHR67_002608 [Xanthomonas arboricola]|nr:hypothetical protein [Xanthomonas campestris]
MACFLIGVTIFLVHPNHDAARIGCYLSFFLFAAGFLREAYVWILPKLQLPLVKLLVAAGSVTAAAAATGVSRMAVNEATGQDPAAFTTTVAFLVPVSFVPVLAALIAIGGVLVIPGTILGSLGKAMITWSKPADLDVILSLARVIGCLAVITSAASVLSATSFLFPTMEWLAGHSALMFDLQPNKVCGEVKEDRVIRLNDGLVIVGRVTDDGVQFVRRACPLSAEDTALRPPESAKTKTSFTPRHSKPSSTR